MRPHAGAQRNQVVEQHHLAGAPVAQRAVPKRIRHHPAEDDAERQHAGLRAVDRRTRASPLQSIQPAAARCRPSTSCARRLPFPQVCALKPRTCRLKSPTKRSTPDREFAEQAQLQRLQRRPEQDQHARQRQQCRAVTPRARPGPARFLLPQQRPDRRSAQVKRHVRRRREPQRPVEGDNINGQRQAAAQPELPGAIPASTAGTRRGYS